MRIRKNDMLIFNLLQTAIAMRKGFRAFSVAPENVRIITFTYDVIASVFKGKRAALSYHHPVCVNSFHFPKYMTKLQGRKTGKS
jgi:hypothetical protein